MHHLTQNAAETIVQLRLTGGGKGQEWLHEIREGESAIVGSGAGCQMQISDPAVSTHQCLFEVQDGRVIFHPWSVDGSTYVNDQIVGDECEIRQQDVVRFGDYELRWEAIGGVVEENAEAADYPQAGAPSSVDEEYDEPEQYAPEYLDAGPAEETFESDPYEEEVTQSLQESEPAPAPEPPPQHQAVPKPPTPLVREHQPVDSATLDVLHAEIALLQKELEDRDALIADLNANNTTSLHADDECKPSKSKSRIDSLLMELQSSDQRISLLEHELRLFEEAHEAEEHERQQIESWVSDIEQRVALREEEIHAEMDVLRGRLQQEKQDRKSLQEKADSDLSSDADAHIQDTLKVLRRDHDVLKEKCQSLVDQNQQLDKELTQLRDATSEDTVQKRIQDALRQERLEICQERAAIHRREQEIATKLREMESHLEAEEKDDRSNPADERFRAFREHLRELHQEDMADFKAPTIGQRLAKLWQRLDGPTDVD